MNAAVVDALRALRSELSDHAITVDVDLTRRLPLVTGNRGQLREVLLNLLHNAIEAMAGVADRPRLLQVITTRQDEGTVVVAIKDTGPGIAPERLNDIFDAFVTTKAHGMGLGLAICQLIIQGHGGQLSAFSNGKDGSLFRYALPEGLADEERSLPAAD
jgi:C4-dicarboxylate-specific signal transduction histidine kinase